MGPTPTWNRLPVSEALAKLWVTNKVELWGRKRSEMVVGAEPCRAGNDEGPDFSAASHMVLDMIV
jgi:hypothetical protein